MKSWEEIKSSVRLGRETVSVEAWGGDVIVAELDALTGDMMQRDWKKLGKPDGDFAGFRAFVIAHTVVDESGNRMFDPERDLDDLNRQPSSVIGKLFDKACELNRLTKSDQEELVKN